jgi:hypothetical protein
MRPVGLLAFIVLLSAAPVAAHHRGRERLGSRHDRRGRFCPRPRRRLAPRDPVNPELEHDLLGEELS